LVAIYNTGSHVIAFYSTTASAATGSEVVFSFSYVYVLIRLYD